MVMILYGWVSPERPSFPQSFLTEVFLDSQGGPNLVVVGENKIKTFLPFPSPALSSLTP